MDKQIFIDPFYILPCYHGECCSNVLSQLRATRVTRTSSWRHHWWYRTCLVTYLVQEPSASFLELLVQEQGMDVGPPQENIQVNEGASFRVSSCGHTDSHSANISVRHRTAWRSDRWLSTWTKDKCWGDSNLLDSLLVTIGLPLCRIGSSNWCLWNPKLLWIPQCVGQI